MSRVAYNKHEGMIPQARKYIQEYGYHPERIYADLICISSKSKNFYTMNKTRLSSTRLDRPSKDPEINVAHKE